VADYAEQLRQIVRSRGDLIGILRTVRESPVPQAVVGAGVIRNAVWDHLHGFASPAPIKDVDVAYFDLADLERRREADAEKVLTDHRPDLDWDVKNQAAVHLWYEEKFGQAIEPFDTIEEAIGSWPETATCVAVGLDGRGQLRVIAPLGLDDLFNLVLRRNPAIVTRDVFERRVREKRFIERWPKLNLIDD
jgi:hypothetical protein